MKIKKIMLSLTCITVFILLAIGSTGNDDEPRVVEDSAPAEVIETTMPEEEQPEEDIGEGSDAESEELLVELALNIMKSNFEGSATVEVNKADKMFILTPVDDVLIEAFNYVAAGNMEVMQAYESYVESQKEMSQSIAEMLPEYSIATANPHDPSLLLLVVWNGIVIYNFADEI